MGEIKNSVDKEALYREKSQKQEEAARQEEQLQTIKTKLARLREQKTVIEELKESLNIESASVCASMEQFTPWKGTKYTTFKTYLEGDFTASYSGYFNKVDDVLDEVCDTITRLENEQYETEGWLAGLRKAINSISNELEKMMN